VATQVLHEKNEGGDCRAPGVIAILTRDESRNPRQKAEVRFCLRKSWKTEGRALGPSESPLRSAYLARLLFLQSEESYENNRLNLLFF
jgi:hypothetical protein